MKRRSFITVSLLAFTCMVLSCKEGTPPEIATASEQPRIASMSPAISIMLDDLGLSSLIVGRHGSDTSLDSSIPVIGDQSGIDYESLARLKPTHVLLQQSVEGAPKLLDELAAERNWSVQSLPLLELSEIPDALNVLAETFSNEPGVPERAESLHERMNAAWSERPDLAKRAGATLCVYWVSPIGVAGPGSFHHDLLVRMGFDALPATGSAYITLDREDLKRLNPDSIFILTPDIGEAELAAAIEPWRELGVSAVDSGRVVVLNNWSYLTPSTAMIDLADRIAATTESWPEQP